MLKRTDSLMLKGDNLALTGDKIRLSSRPTENRGKASTRCNLIGGIYGRPVSVVPVLDLYRNDEFKFSRSSQRPWSADCGLDLKRSKLKTKLNKEYLSLSSEDSSIQSEDIESNILPSTQLFQHLLSEPISSWREGVQVTKVPSTHSLIYQKMADRPNEHQTFPTDTTNLDVKHRPTSTSADEVKSPSDRSITNNQATENGLDKNGIGDEKAKVAFSMSLTPGLATKPPIPRRVEASSRKHNFRANSVTPDLINLGAGDGCHLNPVEPEYMSPVSETADDLSDLKQPQVLEKIVEEDRDYDLFSRNVQTADFPKLSDETCDLLSESFDSLSSGRKTKPFDKSVHFEPPQVIDPTVKLQNWMEENDSNEIVKSEIDTDLSLYNLRLQHNKTNRDGTDSATKKDGKPVVERRQTSEAKLEVQKKKKADLSATKRFAKFESRRPKTFTATAVKAPPDYTPQAQEHEEDSWMSSLQRKPAPQKKNAANKFKPKPKLKPVNYLDFLNNIDELESSLSDLFFDGIKPDASKSESQQREDEDSGSTYDEIVSILQELENEGKKSQKNVEAMKDVVKEMVESTEETTSDEGHPVFDDALESRRRPRSGEFQGEILSPLCKDDEGNGFEFLGPSRNNVNEIISYLDEVDRNCAKSLLAVKEKVQTSAGMTEKGFNLDTIPKLEELLRHTTQELSYYIIDISLRLKDKSSSISLLQRELSALRESLTRITKQTDQNLKEKLSFQKGEYENVVRRHQKFIDQLIADKKTLNQQCEGLIQEMRALEDRYASNMKAAEHRHKVELQKVKEMHMAGEKIRREKWIDSKTQKIKELTVRGLEPELDKMSARHQQDLTDLRSLHKREIEELELRAARKSQQQLESLREQMTIEREKALAQERDVLRQRYEKLVESEETNYQEQRRRLQQEHLQRMADCEEREKQALSEKDRLVKLAHTEYEDKLQAVVRRHNNEISLLKETTEMEMDAFRNNFKKQMAIEMTEKEAGIRERFRKDRDREVDVLLNRYQEEAEENKAQLEASTENRIRRLRDKYEKEIADLEASEKDAKAKYGQTKTRLLETEDTVIDLKASIKQMEGQLEDSKMLSEKMSAERNRLKDLVREEMKQEVSSMQSEIKHLKQDKEEEMQRVYARVKVAVARKDEALSELTRDHAALIEKCRYLENMLEQQRKEYLIK